MTIITSVKNRKGQAMLLAVLALGGAILGATTIAGLLTLYQTRSSTDSEHSAAAIFAADAGVEWSLFDYYCETTTTVNPSSRCLGGTREQVQPGSPAGVLSNGAYMDVTCYDATGVATTSCSDPTAASAISKGASLNSRRAFYLDLLGAIGPLP